MAPFRKSSVQVRPAKPEEVELLKADLAKDKRWEQVDLMRGIIFVSEKNGEIIQFIHARMAWQVEPLKWMRGKKKTCTAYEQKKSTYLLIRNMRDWLSDVRHNPYIRFYFTTVRDRVMQKLAVRFGMIPLYDGNKFFGEDL